MDLTPTHLAIVPGTNDLIFIDKSEDPIGIAHIKTLAWLADASDRDKAFKIGQEIFAMLPVEDWQSDNRAMVIRKIEAAMKKTWGKDWRMRRNAQFN